MQMSQIKMEYKNKKRSVESDTAPRPRYSDQTMPDIEEIEFMDAMEDVLKETEIQQLCLSTTSENPTVRELAVMESMFNFDEYFSGQQEEIPNSSEVDNVNNEFVDYDAYLDSYPETGV